MEMSMGTLPYPHNFSANLKLFLNKTFIFRVINDSVSLETEKERGCKLNSETHNCDLFESFFSIFHTFSNHVVYLTLSISL